MEVEKDHNYITSLGTVLHNCVDGIRYFVVARAMAAEAEKLNAPVEEDDGLKDYNTFMTGGVISPSYMGV